MTAEATTRPSLITGATGLLGSHIADQLVKAGQAVRALVRGTSDARFLRSIGVEVVVGDLGDAESVRSAVAGASRVYHCAAKVGDWGDWSEFRRDCLDATENLALASVDAGVDRFLHVSSTSAYGHPREGQPPVDESAPLGQRLWPFWDYYTISKVECERILWRLADTRGLPLTIVRPSWLYGERDRITLRRLVGRLRERKFPLIGPGDNPLSAVYAGNVADLAIRAANDPGSVSEAYNVTHQGQMTQREFLSMVAEAAHAPPPTKTVPYGAAFAVATLYEARGKLLRQPRPPLITRYATWLMGRDLAYSSEKARTKLGWQPRWSNEESIHRSVEWFLAHSSQDLAEKTG